jgi:hypothetical protein
LFLLDVPVGEVAMTVIGSPVWFANATSSCFHSRSQPCDLVRHSPGGFTDPEADRVLPQGAGQLVGIDLMSDSASAEAVDAVVRQGTVVMW